MKKKALAVLLAATMTAGLTACGGGDAAPTADSGSKTEADSAATGDDASGKDAAPADNAASDADTSEHVVITYMTTGDAPSGDALNTYNDMMEKLNAILTEKVNAELETYFISWTDYLANYNLTLAQMDGSVDLVGTSSDWLDSWPNAKNGAFLELSEEMLQTYAPQTWANVPADHWELCKYDGEIYLMPEDNYAQWTNHGYIYRMDWAKEAGLADGVHSWEDMTAYWKYCKETFPDLVALWDSDGTSYNAMSGGWITSHSDYVSIDGINAGAMWGGKKDDLYTVYSPYMTETELLVEFAKLMKEWDEIGVWPTDVLNNTSMTEDMNADMYRIGQVAAVQKHTEMWTGLVSALPQNTIYQDDPDAETGFFYFGEEQGNVVELSITHGAMAVSAGSKNPERALMVYDLLRNDPECHMLFCQGVEGVSYEVTEDGLMTKPEGFNADTQNINGITNFWWGRNDDILLRNAQNNWEKIDELYAVYDKIKIPYPYGQFIVNTDNIQSYIQNITEIHTNYMKQICYGKYSGTAEEIVAEYQSALKAAGIDTVTEELQRQMDAIYK
ncbi:MAG: ABC transporter substrate-binding protein [Lachnospiraceae bacterium]|nr:ABC transporter substrate-binding protein [Lachnospiraceae bacterium]MDE7001925.1 ABC transporter substrate-binding protein [Lachnospiraceae bacterium]